MSFCRGAMNPAEKLHVAQIKWSTGHSAAVSAICRAKREPLLRILRLESATTPKDSMACTDIIPPHTPAEY